MNDADDGAPIRTRNEDVSISDVACAPGERNELAIWRPAQSAPATPYYLFKYYPPNVPQMTGEDLQASGTRVDLDSITGQPIVTMEFTRSGGQTFQQITRDEWVRGQLRTAPQHFAIVVDREIKTFPQIDYLDASISGGIGGRRAEIQGLDSMREAKRIAVVLQSGALPVRLRIVKSHL